MPTIIEQFAFFPLHYNGDGKAVNDAELAALQQHVAAEQTSDVVLIAHGFLNNEQDATGLYTRFLTTFRAHLARPEFQGIAQRKYAIGGVFWPSKAFSEGAPGDGGSTQSADTSVADREEAAAALRDARDTIADATQRPKIDQALQMLDRIDGNAAAQDEFAKLVLSLTDGIAADPTEGLEQIRAKDGSELLQTLRAPVILAPAKESDGDEGGAMSFGGGVFPDSEGDGSVQSFGSVVGSIFHGVGKLLNVTTWYVMKNRSGSVGANGVAPAVQQIHASSPTARIHLVGHSLGGRLMAGCAKALASTGVRPDSLTLLEAAFSHYGFSAKGPNNPEGFFRPVVTSHVVKGPWIATFSAQDTVVGNTYALASRLAGDNAKAIGDKNDQYGGIGRNGAQQCDVAVEDKLHLAGVPYKFPVDHIMSLDGSGGLITGHSDVTNENVTYAFASALTQT